MHTSASLRSLFWPTSVAVIGASRTPGKLGYHTLENLTRSGYAGKVYAVNARQAGDSGYASVREIGGPVDCAFIVVPAERVLESLVECADAGVKTAIIGASGFAEAATDDAVEAQARVAAIALESGMRVLGPNTNGLINTASNLYLGFNAEHSRVQKQGPIAIVSHSGALLGGIASSLRTLGGGLSSFVAVGNEADVGLLDVLEYLVEDDSTSVIGVVMESLDDGDRFAGIAHRAHALAKRMVALKIGRSSAGAHAAQAHSSRLSGSARAYDALLSSCGVASVRSVESLTGACVVLSAEFDSGRTGKHVQNDLSLTCISTSGAGGALLADFAEDRRLSLVCGGSGSWNLSVSAELESITSQGKIAHPLDVGILKGNWAAADDFMAVLERHGHDGPVAAYVHNGPTGKRDMDLLQALNARRKRSTAPVVVAAPGGLDEALTNQYLDHGIPVFRDMTSCFDALQAWQATRHFMMEVPPPVSTSSLTKPPSGRLPRVLSELESAQLLRSAGIPVVESFVVANAPMAVAALSKCSGNAVMKAAPEGVAHKNDAGLVLTGLESQDDVLQAFETLQARIGGGGFAIETPIFMQPMLRARAELIVGVASEPGLGYFLLVGLGGIHAEVLDQVVVLPVNASRARMEAATRTSTVGRLLNHLDPEGTCLEEVLTILVKLRTFLSNQSGAVESLDLNPVLVTRSGCIAVDALINQR